MKKVKYLGLFLVALTLGVGHAKAYVMVTEDKTLEEDINELVYVNGKNVTIDLNGHNIIGDNGAIYAYNGSNLTIKGEGIIQSTESNAIYSTGGSTVTLESGTVKAQEFGVLVMGDSTFTMNGGTIETVDNCGVGGNGSDKDEYKNYTININGGTITSNIKSNGYVSCGIYHPNKGTVNFNGGTINSTNGAGIVQRAGVLNIKGGTINAKGNMTGKVGDSRVVVSASAVVVDREANYPEVATLETNISGATLNGDAEAVEVLGSDDKIELTGGTYSSMPEEEQIPEGYNAYEVLNSEEEQYVVVKDEDLEYFSFSALVDKEEFDEEEVALIEKELSKYTLAGYYGVAVLASTPDEDVVDPRITETLEPIEVKLELPKDLPAVKEGFTRKYVVIRVHNGEATVIKDVKDNGDGTVTFKSDKFSTYALAYVDEENKKEETKEEVSPKTFDAGTMSYILLTLVSIVLGGYAAFKLKKRLN